MATQKNAPVKAVIVGCGAVGRGMGWYHAKQLLAGRVARTQLVGIVEPFLMGEGRNTSEADELRQWLAKNGPEVRACQSMAELGMQVDAHAVALIAVRTADSPRIFREAVELGFRNVLLEKPGATNVVDLAAMAELAQEKDVRVLMGYNRNVAKYVTDTNKMAMETEGAQVTFFSYNAYKEEELDECFERNSEGLLKNMLIHELVLMCSFFDMGANNVADVVVDVDRTSREVRRGPRSGAEFTDFRKLGITVVSKAGVRVSLSGDRCAGAQSFAQIAVGGEMKATFLRPDGDEQAAIKVLEAEHPGCMPYFYLQDMDYLVLKERLTAQILANKSGVPEGLASLSTGVEALRLAEFLMEEIDRKLK